MQRTEAVLRSAPSGVHWYESKLLTGSRDSIVHFFSRRDAGLSSGPFEGLNVGLHVGDDYATVIRNRLLLFGSLDIRMSETTFCRQVHEPAVTVVDEALVGRGAWSHEAAVDATDAMVTTLPNVCLVVLLADCVPVIALDPTSGTIGVAHAGWRGTIAGVTSAMIGTMGSAGGADPSEILVAIGPAISSKAYEVGPEVVAATHERFGERACELIQEAEGRTYFDLWRANEVELHSAGIQTPHIDTMRIETEVLGNSLYSERTGGRPTGRFCAGVIRRSRL
jgi:YfiH family protein